MPSVAISTAMVAARAQKRPSGEGVEQGGREARKQGGKKAGRQGSREAGRRLPGGGEYGTMVDDDGDDGDDGDDDVGQVKHGSQRRYRMRDMRGMRCVSHSMLCAWRSLCCTAKTSCPAQYACMRVCSVCVHDIVGRLDRLHCRRPGSGAGGRGGPLTR
jgi:hypothetical protein